RLRLFEKIGSFHAREWCCPLPPATYPLPPTLHTRSPHDRYLKGLFQSLSSRALDSSFNFGHDSRPLKRAGFSRLS
ncbi:MAG: hypothetical protein LBF22_06845, partial [Deltaproteobacteria bacterium]|nr:hypothetical protein [Deltaproteobacteria bacterium]